MTLWAPLMFCVVHIEAMLDKKIGKSLNNENRLKETPSLAPILTDVPNKATFFKVFTM